MDPAEHDALDPARWDDRPGDPVVVQTWLGAPARSYARRPATVVDALDRAVRRWPAAAALVDGDRRLTYAELGAAVETAAASLRGRGLGPGDAVAVAAGNGLELAVLLLACARARLVMVGLNTRLAPPQWAYMTEHMQVRLRLAEARFPLPGAEPLAAVLAEAAAAGLGVRPGARAAGARTRRTRSCSPPARPAGPRPRRSCTAARCTPA